MFDREFDIKALVDHLVEYLKKLIAGVLQAFDWLKEKSDEVKSKLPEDESAAE